MCEAGNHSRLGSLLLMLLVAACISQRKLVIRSVTGQIRSVESTNVANSACPCYKLS